MKKILILLPIILLLAASCNQKQALNGTPKLTTENQVVGSTTPATITAPVEILQPAQTNTTTKAVDNSAALQQAQKEATNAKIAQQQAEDKLAQLQAEQKATQDALDAASTTKAQADTQATACVATNDNLTQLTAKLNLITQETSSIYSDYRDSKSFTTGQDFNDSYNKMLAMSAGYYSQISQLQIDTTGLSTVLSGDNLDEVQSNLNNGEVLLGKLLT